MNAQELADKLNREMQAGNSVLMRTYGRSTLYAPGRAGCFFAKGGRLYVRRGKRADDCTTAQFHIGRPAQK